MVFILLPLTFKTQLSEGGKHLRDALFNSAKKRGKKKKKALFRFITLYAPLFSTRNLPREEKASQASKGLF